MLRYNHYVMAESLEEAYTLNQKKGNVLIGGMGWLKMGKKQRQTAIDLSNLGLDQIVETKDAFTIGAMVSLGELERHPGFLEYTRQEVRESLRHIVGTQFRNGATVGGSIYGRFGFSDVLTFFLALDCEVELYQEGRIPLAEYAARDTYDRDMIVNLIVKKQELQLAYESFRNQSTDLPVLTVAVSRSTGGCITVVGARPARAAVAEDTEGFLTDIEQLSSEEQTKQIRTFAAWAADQFVYGDNMRGSAEYRRKLAEVLIYRAWCRAVREKEVE